MDGQTTYERMAIDLLRRAKEAREEIQIRVPELAAKYGIQQRFVCEKLAELHAEKLIRLSGYDEYEHVKSFDEWGDPEYFFYYASPGNGNYKRVLLLVRGAELLERLASEQQPETVKRTIGFHG